MNRRDEPASTVLTSNQGLEEWGPILGDEGMAWALLDPVLHRSHSDRLCRPAELSRPIPPTAARAVSPEASGVPVEVAAATSTGTPAMDAIFDGY